MVLLFGIVGFLVFELDEVCVCVCVVQMSWCDHVLHRNVEMQCEGILQFIF